MNNDRLMVGSDDSVKSQVVKFLEGEDEGWRVQKRK